MPLAVPWIAAASFGAGAGLASILLRRPARGDSSAPHPPRVDVGDAERSRAEDEGQHALSLLEATLDSTTDGVLVVDRSGKIVRFNERFVQLWRIPPDVIESGDDDRAIATVLAQLEDPQVFLARVRQLYAHPEAESHDVLRFRDGRVFERLSRPQRLHGEVIGRVWTFRDVTDRERALAEQRLAAAREATIARNLDAALFTFTLAPDLRIASYEYFSLGAEGLFGVPLDQLLGEPGFWEERLHPEDRESLVLPAFRGLFRLEPATIQFRYQSSKDIYRWHRSRFVPRRESDGRIHVDAIETDVTERVALEEQLRHAQKLEAVGQLAGGIAHDFNNILTAVIGYADLLLTRTSPHDPNRRAVQEIHKGGERAAALTRQLLAFGRRSPALPRLVDLSASVRDLMPMLQRLAGEDIGFDLQTAGGLGSVRIDPSQFEQVVVNLVVNARDAMPGGGTLRIEIDRALVSPADVIADPDLAVGPYLRVRVRDSGRGIDPQALEHIFEPFFTTKGPGRGTGLGLATVYGIVRQNRGRVRAANVDVGAEFEILLPEVRAEGAPALPAAPEGPFPSGQETVLLVEDDPALLALGREVLSELGYRVHTATSGLDALRVIEEQRPECDILVTDVVMPGMGGRELAERLHASRPRMPVLYVSGYHQDEMLRESATNDGGVAFLEKPYTAMVLARRVREMLDSRVPATARVSGGPVQL